MTTSTSGAPARAARPGWLPWVVAGVLAVVVAALIVALAHVMDVRKHADARADAAGNAVSIPVTTRRRSTLPATEAANLLTYSRANFDADWQRSLDGATGDLLKDHKDQKDDALKNITAKKIDLTAKVQQKAFVSADENDTVVVLVTVNGYIKNDKGATSSAIPQRLELTMVRQGDDWLASNLTSVGIQ